MSTYFKILFLGASLSLGISACQQDAASASTEVAQIPKENISKSTPVKEPISVTSKTDTLVVKEESKISERDSHKIAADTSQMSPKLSSAELKKQKEAAASEERRRKRREKRQQKREEEKALAEARAKSKLSSNNKNKPVENVEITSPTGKGKAAIYFKEQTHNFGIIQQGESVKHQFKFKNTGSSELVISNVTVSCGCTHPSYPFIPLAPGEEGYIGVHFNSKGRLGKQKPTVTVYTNAYPVTYDLHLEGFVDARRESEPAGKDSL